MKADARAGLTRAPLYVDSHWAALGEQWGPYRSVPIAKLSSQLIKNQGLPVKMVARSREL